MANSSLPSQTEGEDTMSTNTQRVVIFVFASIVALIGTLLYNLSSFQSQVPWAFIILAGIQGLIIYEVIYRTQGWVRWATLPVYIILYSEFGSITSYIMGIFYYNISSSKLSSWRISSAFTDPYSLLTATVTVFAALFFISGNKISLRGIRSDLEHTLIYGLGAGLCVFNLFQNLWFFGLLFILILILFSIKEIRNYPNSTLQRWDKILLFILLAFSGAGLPSIWITIDSLFIHRPKPGDLGILGVVIIVIPVAIAYCILVCGVLLRFSRQSKEVSQ
jgi:hypothetical protein